jgi:hypothetical protein
LKYFLLEEDDNGLLSREVNLGDIKNFAKLLLDFVQNYQKKDPVEEETSTGWKTMSVDCPLENGGVLTYQLNQFHPWQTFSVDDVEVDNDRVNVKAKLHPEDFRYFDDEAKREARAEQTIAIMKDRTDQIVQRLAQLPLSEAKAEITKMNCGAMVKGYYLNLVQEAKRKVLLNEDNPASKEYPGYRVPGE